MANSWFPSNLVGTMMSYFKIGGTGGFRLKNSGGNLNLRNAADAADVAITVSTINISGDNYVLNSDAAGTGADWSITISRPTTGMTAAWTLKLPVGPGTANQVLQTDGSGNTSWVSAASTAACISTDTTSLAYNTTSPVTMFTLPANAVVEAVRVFVDTAFNATGPSMSVGVTGTTSKYMGTGDVDLTTAGIYEIFPGLTADGTTNALIITFSAGTGGSAGAARIEVDYTVPA